ncbi:hypothetical protein Pma05_30350 [Plantactinospora mayteni]|uniref:Uncharacterized protein n=1 Tax=Plantactinospora mayteni TaxID=566021 RepID=A0ABQ4EP86_9ACTN|nr:hypothetical protein Pma05_30350 [Plantactinospora mayteni]
MPKKSKITARYAGDRRPARSDHSASGRYADHSASGRYADRAGPVGCAGWSSGVGQRSVGEGNRYVGMGEQASRTGWSQERSDDRNG